MSSCTLESKVRRRSPGAARPAVRADDMLHDDLMREKGAPAVAGGARCLRVRCYAPSDPAPSSLLVCARIGVAAALAVLGDSNSETADLGGYNL